MKCCGESSDASVNPDSSESLQHTNDRNMRAPLRKRDMSQENRSLFVMLEKDRVSLEKIFGPAIVFEIEDLFHFRGGPALRHQAAHGLVSDEACNGTDAIYACWFIFRLCCLHVAERWDELAEWMDGNQAPERAAKPPDPAEVAAGAVEDLALSVDPADS